MGSQELQLNNKFTVQFVIVHPNQAQLAIYNHSELVPWLATLSLKQIQELGLLVNSVEKEMTYKLLLGNLRTPHP